MAKLHFFYGCMSAGKSTYLLQVAHNYKSRNMKAVIISPTLDTRTPNGKIRSQIGIESEATVFDPDDNLLQGIEFAIKETKQEIKCVLVDEAQFLTRRQAQQLACVVDDLNIPVMAYGLRTDFRGDLFPGSEALLALADDIREIRTICDCGRRATMHLRLDKEGKVLKEGEQIEIGNGEKYRSVCRKHWKESMER